MQYTVKQARVLMDLTQEQMAEKMGISRWTYRKIEENPESATIKQAKQIAKITQIPIDNIFFANGSTTGGDNGAASERVCGGHQDGCAQV